MFYSLHTYNNTADGLYKMQILLPLSKFLFKWELASFGDLRPETFWLLDLKN